MTAKPPQTLQISYSHGADFALDILFGTCENRPKNLFSSCCYAHIIFITGKGCNNKKIPFKNKRMLFYFCSFSGLIAFFIW